MSRSGSPPPPPTPRRQPHSGSLGVAITLPTSITNPATPSSVTMNRQIRGSVCPASPRRPRNDVSPPTSRPPSQTRQPRPSEAYDIPAWHLGGVSSGSQFAFCFACARVRGRPSRLMAHRPTLAPTRPQNGGDEADRVGLTTRRRNSAAASARRAFAGLEGGLDLGVSVSLRVKGNACSHSSAPLAWSSIDGCLTRGVAPCPARGATGS